MRPHRQTQSPFQKILKKNSHAGIHSNSHNITSGNQSAVHDAHGLPVIAMTGTGLAVLLTWLVMLVMLLGSGRIHKGGQQIFTRFLGLILISMGLQFVLTGLKEFAAGTV